MDEKLFIYYYYFPVCWNCLHQTIVFLSFRLKLICNQASEYMTATDASSTGITFNNTAIVHTQNML